MNTGVKLFTYRSGLDPLEQALMDHQRHVLGMQYCLCGWGELGRSHAAHIAEIIRPIVEDPLKEEIERLRTEVSDLRIAHAALQISVRTLDPGRMRGR